MMDRKERQDLDRYLTRDDYLNARLQERQEILDIIEQGITDRMDIDTHASHWAEGALDALEKAGYSIELRSKATGDLR